MPSDTTKKRPMGLKARAASSKKARGQEELTEAGAQVVNDFEEEDTATVMLKNDNDEDANEMDELESIFQSALELELTSPERAFALLRGTIHESDRMLRVHDQGEEAEELEARFYYIYGSALFSITKIAADELESQQREYLELAQLRLEQAKAAMAGSEPFAWRVHAGLGKIALELLAENDDEEENDALAANGGALSSLDRAIDILAKDEEDAAAQTEALTLVDLTLSLADSRRLTDRISGKLVSWSEAKLDMLEAGWAKLADSSDRAEEIKHLRARALWLHASVLLEQQDEETGEVPDKDEVLRLLNDANRLLDDAKSGDALLLRGEIQINLGNLQEDKREQEELYKLAVDTFKLAQANGDLPEHFEQFIDDFENDGSDDESEE
ncbi:hypothetical protein GGI04_002332 [Coemansia thaxteri]|uniref:Enhancer of translation termination 1 n=1 Tax=Coemansia thaxteri TaxID=2663907 RepID=A0A9W8EG59_9FUNG|nr:hypothetical protein GGI04_002332 [Coemansia thaxteri]KAJ2005528.1 hypothetical protein H4R26_001910 [Coemansia thaxteri]KAJ2470978.1 hypothetical protein GGI02_002575 [Coemansia sp. RSA 2322]KAJ2486542.1 hypothetical protein EV174_001058 [Coemansia sp. RSA 2320]